jgi:hypothetical protein
MTIMGAQLADVGAAIAWCLAAVAAVLGARPVALWGNIVTSLIIGGVTLASLAATLFADHRPAETVHGPEEVTVFTLSPAPQLWIASITVALAVAAILLSLQPWRSGQKRFWAAWLLNAPGASLALVGLLATSFR